MTTFLGADPDLVSGICFLVLLKSQIRFIPINMHFCEREMIRQCVEQLMMFAWPVVVILQQWQPRLQDKMARMPDCNGV